MEWLIFVILAHLVWAFPILISKLVLTRYIRSIFIYGFAATLMGLLPLLLIPAKGLIIPSPFQLVVSIVSGMLYLYAMLPYYKALTLEEVSRVIPLWRFVPLFVLLFAVLLLGERLNRYELISFLLLMSGGYLISVRRISDPFKISKAFYLMILSSFIFGVYHTLTKYVYLNQAYFHGFVIMRAGSFLGALTVLFFTKYRQQVIMGLPEVTATALGLLFVNGILNITGLALLNYAVSIGPISLISAASGIQSIFVFCLATALATKFPRLWQEEIGKRILVQKLIGIAKMAIGTAIIAIV